MADLILELTVMISLAVIVYLMAAAVPRIEEEEEEGEGKTQRTVLPLDKLDNFLIKLKDKSLRRTKILLMRIDNFISRQLKTKKP